MWRREMNRDFLWAGLLVGLLIGGVVGVLLGTEFGRNTRDRLEQAAKRVRSRFNGEADSHEPPVEVEAETTDSDDS